LLSIKALTTLKREIRIQNILILLAVLFIIQACSTRKNTFTRRVYHNMTAHYNAWWNGNESLKEGVKALAVAHKDNYTEVLPVFQYGTKDDAQSINPQMDRAIEKGAKVIKMHSIFIKGKEFIRWIDDSYLLIGKAQFYKQDYLASIRTFNYIISQYKYNEIRFDAMIWLARCYTQTGEFTTAETMLDQVKNKIDAGEAPEKYKKHLMLAYADCLIKQKSYSASKEYLSMAINLNKNSKTRTRLRFILAQIAQRGGDMTQASELYRKVIRKNPTYEMAFNAKINLAMCFESSTGDSKDIIKKLKKMIRDSKNKEFLDQVYYALAQIYLKEKNYDEAVKMLRLSVSSSVANNNQKSLSSLTIADIYYDRNDYINAQAYYDTSLTFLPNTYPNYKTIKSKSEVLTKLVKNIKIAELEDSLQTMASLPDAQRTAKIQGAINKYRVEKAEKKRQEDMGKGVGPAINTASQSGGVFGNKDANWYFYNPATLNFGYNEFIRKWGNRKLEDNWRLSNKQATDFGITENKKDDDEDAEESAVRKDSLPKGAMDPENPLFYSKDIPITKEKLDRSNKKLSDAMFNIGLIYFEGLNDSEKSIEAFEKFMKRFPEDNHTLSTYYQMYRIYNQKEDATKKKTYKDLILSKFPESDYAKIISDPEYYKQILAKNSESKQYYETTYKSFQKGEYNQTISRSREADKTLKLYNPESGPKFMYIESLSLGKVYGVDSLLSGFNRLAKRYPESAANVLATQLIELINKNSNIQYTFASTTPVKPNSSSNTKVESKQAKNNITPNKSESKEEPKEKKDAKDAKDLKNTQNEQVKKDESENTEYTGIYKWKSDVEQFMLISANSKKTNINILKIKISDFCRKNNPNDNLEITSILLDETNHLITVSKFPNAQAAMQFYKAITTDTYVFGSIEPSAYEIFPVSTENFPTFYRIKNTDEYLQFFKQTYMKLLK